MAPRTHSARCGNNSRQCSRQISYREDTTPDLGDESLGKDENIESDEDLENDELASKSIPFSSAPKKRSRTSSSLSSRKRSTASTRKRKAPPSGRSAPVSKGIRLGAQNGDHKNVPNWQNLPYQILSDIFLYTVRPPTRDNWEAWLVQNALLCKSFVEPALSALYYMQNVSPVMKTQRLLNLLRSPTTTYLNYGKKIKWLVVAVATRNKSLLNLSQIIAFTPQLRGIHITGWISSTDLGWGQLLKGLETNHIPLREWIWTAVSQRYAPLRCIYPTSSLQTIDRIIFHHETPVLWKAEDFATAINALPRLKHIQFNLSTLRDPEVLLSLLSVNLESLRLVDCKLISANALTLFLAAWGQELRLLAMDDNNSHRLSFLVNLAQSCPQLQTLKINFDTFCNTPSPAEPASLRSGEIPTWPSSLRRLDLLQYGGLTLGSANLFLSSLVDSAASLPNLRYIRIRLSLGESGWQNRVTFRQKWTKIFLHVFLRVSEPPNPHLQSLGAYQALKIAQENIARKSIADESHPASSGPSSGPSSATPRKSSDPLSQVGIEPGRSEGKKEPNVEKSSQLPRGRRSDRLRQHAGISQRSSSKPCPPFRRRRRRARESDPDATSEDSALEDRLEEYYGGHVRIPYENLPVQGLCDFVDVLSDNLRPSHEQLRESDFLDEELSGDEDWNGSGDE